MKNINRNTIQRMKKFGKQQIILKYNLKLNTIRLSMIANLQIHCEEQKTITKKKKNDHF